MLKYECDICHKINSPADTYGPGVIPQGKALRWRDLVNDSVGLEIMPVDVAEDPLQVCGACLKNLIEEMIHDLWTEPIYPSNSTKPSGRTPEIAEDLSGDSSSDSNMREMRAESEVQESSAAEYNPLSIAPISICDNCYRRANQRPGRDCVFPGFHVYA